MRNLKILLVAVIGISFLASCTPYEDGPAISFTKAEKKIVNTWVQTEAYENGVSTDIDETSSITYNEDNTFVVNSDLLGFNGTWSLNNDEDVITLSYTLFGFSLTQKNTILRLTKDEFWVRYEDGNDTFIDHFAPKE